MSISFGLTNGPATFQAYMDDCLRPYMDDFVVCYLNDILTYSEDPAHHEGHVTEVLKRLREYGWYFKAEKREFSVKIGLHPHPRKTCRCWWAS
jgi:hypothetical protein